MNTAELTTLLQTLGCPPEKSGEMAAQLDKRAQQLAAQKGRTYDEALRHLLGLMSQGWAAAGKNPDAGQPSSGSTRPITTH